MSGINSLLGMLMKMQNAQAGVGLKNLQAFTTTAAPALRQPEKSDTTPAAKALSPTSPPEKSPPQQNQGQPLSPAEQAKLMMSAFSKRAEGEGVGAQPKEDETGSRPPMRRPAASSCMRRPSAKVVAKKPAGKGKAKAMPKKAAVKATPVKKFDSGPGESALRAGHCNFDFVYAAVGPMCGKLFCELSHVHDGAGLRALPCKRRVKLYMHVSPQPFVCMLDWYM